MSTPTVTGLAVPEGVERVGSKLLFENDRVRVWELRLEPGEIEALHEHQHDYVMIQVDGDKVAGEFEPDSGGPWGGLTHVEGDVANGQVIFAERGGRERAHNVGAKPFYEFIVELKD
jgi:beta-alanine degradation protein BauB